MGLKRKDKNWVGQRGEKDIGDSGVVCWKGSKHTVYNYQITNKKEKKLDLKHFYGFCM